MRLLLLLSCLALVLAACTRGGGDEQLRDDLRTQAQAMDQLRERLSELEDELDAVRASDATTDLGERLEALEEAAPLLNDRVGEAESRLGNLEDGVGAVREDVRANDASITSLETAVAELRSRLSNLEDVVNQLQRDLGALRSDHNLLEERFANHTRHPPG